MDIRSFFSKGAKEKMKNKGNKDEKPKTSSHVPKGTSSTSKSTSGISKTESDSKSSLTNLPRKRNVDATKCITIEDDDNQGEHNERNVLNTEDVAVSSRTSSRLRKRPQANDGHDLEHKKIPKLSVEKTSTTNEKSMRTNEKSMRTNEKSMRTNEKSMTTNEKSIRTNENLKKENDTSKPKKRELLQKDEDIQKSKKKMSVKSQMKRPQSKLSSSNDLWPDKYRPRKVSELVGNADIAKKLLEWLRTWDDIHRSGNAKKPKSSNFGDNKTAKAVLLSGPPGIGKSSLASLVARECGYEITEFNASDTRSKKILEERIRDVVNNSSISFNGSQLEIRKRVVIMDEVDGMSSGDRGGMAELIRIIKTSKSPIICICNDRQSTKVRSLSNSCYDLRCRRPQRPQIMKRMKEIAQLEGMQVEDSALSQIIERFGNDIRQLLNFLQMWRRTSSSITEANVQQEFSQMEKDDIQRMNPFSATQQIFHFESNFHTRMESFFVDYDIMPLMIQQNYVHSILNSREKDAMLRLTNTSLAADCIAESDILSVYIRGMMSWDLLTKQAAMNVGAATYAKGFIGNPEFTMWMGKNSTTMKNRRYLGELAIHMKTNISAGQQGLRLDYIPYMKELILQPLMNNSVDAVEQSVLMLDECGISKNDLAETFESFKFSNVARLSYDKLDSSLKSALTRRYNQQSHKSQALVESALATKSKKSNIAMSSDMVDESEILEDADDPEEQDDDLSVFKRTVKKGAVKKVDVEGKGRKRSKSETPFKRKRR